MGINWLGKDLGIVMCTEVLLILWAYKSHLCSECNARRMAKINEDHSMAHLIRPRAWTASDPASLSTPVPVVERHGIEDVHRDQMNRSKSSLSVY